MNPRNISEIHAEETEGIQHDDHDEDDDHDVQDRFDRGRHWNVCVDEPESYSHDNQEKH